MGKLAMEVPTILGRAEPVLAREAVALGIEVGDRPTIALGSLALGLTALARGDAAAAVASLAEAVEIWSSLDDRPMHTYAVACLGIAHLRAGDVEIARPLLREASQGAGDAPLYVGIWAMEGAADWLGATGRAEPATTIWAAADATREASLDRSFPMAPEFFAPPRLRDRSDLRPAAYEAARASGEAMTLRDALDYMIRALDAAAADAFGAPAAAGHGRRGRYDLTPREMEVLALIVAGRSDGEIADALFISKKTAAVHVGNIKGKLGAQSRIEIVRIALRRGLVEIGP
jgi:DNA-binding CsgD family transcriptional regulator